MTEVKWACSVCDTLAPHEHFIATTPNGGEVPAMRFYALDERAEVRDSETGEVLFPAIKGPLRVVGGYDQ